MPEKAAMSEKTLPETKRPILLAAGGTGGHLFPAEALAEVLTHRGEMVELVDAVRVGDEAGEAGKAVDECLGSATGVGAEVELRRQPDSCGRYADR